MVWIVFLLCTLVGEFWIRQRRRSFLRNVVPYSNSSQYGLVGNPVLFLFVLYCIRCAWILTDVVRMVPGLTLFEKFQLGRLWKGVLIMSLVWFCIVVLLRWGGPSFQRLGLRHRRTFYYVLNIPPVAVFCGRRNLQQRWCAARPSEARASPKILWKRPCLSVSLSR